MSSGLKLTAGEAERLEGFLEDDAARPIVALMLLRQTPAALCRSVRRLLDDVSPARREAGRELLDYLLKAGDKAAYRDQAKKNGLPVQ